jgi:hypothetical protein
MSAFLSSSDCIGALATYWERKSSRGFNTAEGQINRAVMFSTEAMGGAYNPTANAATTERLLKATKGNALRCVFGILLNENIRSLKARYDDCDDMTDTTGYVARSIPVVDYWIQRRETGHIVSLLDGYCYQACESDDWKQSIAYMLCQQIKGYLLEDLSKRDAGDDRHWADFTAPEDPRETHMKRVLADINSRAVK